MKLYSDYEKKIIENEFFDRKGMYSRLYDKDSRYGDGYGNPCGIMFRCSSKVDEDRMIIVRYMKQNPYKLDVKKDDFENDKLRGMAMATRTAERYLKKCKKESKELSDFEEIVINETLPKYFEFTKKYLEVFLIRAEKYYKKKMKVIILWA